MGPSVLVKLPTVQLPVSVVSPPELDLLITRLAIVPAPQSKGESLVDPVPSRVKVPVI